MAIGSKLREEREKQDLSLAKLKQRTGLTPGYLSRVENGKQIPAREYTEQLAVALGLDAHEFVKERDKSEYTRLGLDPKVAEMAVELNALDPEQREQVFEALRGMLELHEPDGREPTEQPRDAVAPREGQHR